MNVSKNRFLIHFIYSVMVVCVGLTLYACANMARPGGGAYDEEPPVFVRSKPTPLQTRVTGQKIEIIFNENIKLDKPSEKVVVSPPQVSMPIVKSNARTVTVELKDTLLPNTTYTIEFGDAIQDNNEGNPLKDFSLAFSTGDRIDTMQISGTVLNAADLEPISGMYVGIQPDLADSAFLKKPFVRIGKTNELGKFFIRNITPGSYRVYGLKDVNSNYLFDIPSEDIAFVDSLVVPTAEIKMHRDTVWKDSLTIDSIRIMDVTHYYPDDLILLAFNENKKNVYLEKAERLSANKVSFYFSAPKDSLPRIEGLNFDAAHWAQVESSPHNDTVSYWIKDSLIYKIDTLKLTATYLYTDTLNQLVPKTDTLDLFVRGAKKAEKKKEEPKKKKKGEVVDSVKIEFLPLKDQIGSSLEIGSRPRISFDEPILDFDQANIRLELKKDSTYVLQPSELVRIPGKMRDYELKGKFQPGSEYVLTIDSATFTGLYGLHNNTFTKNFKVKTVEEYGNLLFSISGVRDSAFVELLDSKDAPVMKAPVKNGEAKFIHVKPGTYYARIVLDKNGNGKYDTGDYSQKRQPEEVRYFPESLNLRANWDVKQEWDLYAKPLIKQKPLEITKNKPKEETKRHEQRNNDQRNNNRSGSGQTGTNNQFNQYGGGNFSGGSTLRR
ncbi:MAG: Ig-like domain-containing protein [Bacteroidales bacterium]